MIQQQTKSNALTYAQPGSVTNPEVQTIVNVCRPLEAQGYAPIPTQGDRLAMAIPLVLLAGLAFAGSFWLFSRPSVEQQRLVQENAQLAAENAAIAGCIAGVRGQ